MEVHPSDGPVVLIKPAREYVRINAFGRLCFVSHASKSAAVTKINKSVVAPSHVSCVPFHSLLLFPQINDTASPPDTPDHKHTAVSSRGVESTALGHVGNVLRGLSVATRKGCTDGSTLSSCLQRGRQQQQRGRNICSHSLQQVHEQSCIKLQQQSQTLR